MITADDNHFMQKALELAQKGRGFVSPNPMVGCVIVKNNKIIATGYHKKFGKDHAEIDALKKIKFKASGSTLYVTLEPCYHYGKTPPCVDALIKAKIKRVVVAVKDPNPQTSGKSLRKLRKHSVEVTVGVLKNEAMVVNKVFFKAQTQGKPYVIAKVAQSLDGKIALAKGKRTQITGLASQNYVQELRQTVDAVLVGRNTVQVDNPLLNVRDPKKFQPKRVILDSQLKTNLKSKIFKSIGGDVIFCCTLPKTHKNVLRFLKKDITVLCLPNSKKLSLKTVLKKLFELNIHSLLVEGGAEIFTSFLKENCVDEWHFLVAPVVLGQKGVEAFKKSHQFLIQNTKSQTLGKDALMIFKK